MSMRDRDLMDGARPDPAISGIAFEPRINGFVIRDGALIAEILRSDDFHVVDYARHFQEIADRTELDLAASIEAMRQMPLANEGPAHRTLRRRSAQAVSDVWHANAGEMERYIVELAGATFGTEGKFDLVSQFSVPVFNALYRLWSGVTLVDELAIAQVFCGRMGLNRRLDLDAAIGRLKADLDGAAPSISRDVALSFAVLASDSLAGSLSLSLWTLLSEVDGRRISDIRLPLTLPSTAVPYVDRIAVADVEIQGHRFGKGARVRLMLGDTATAGASRALFFGAGRHACVGKSMTNHIWKSIAAALAQIEFRVTAVSFAERRPDHVFHYLQSARVHIHG
jgi:hypothetical protein